MSEHTHRRNALLFALFLIISGVLLRVLRHYGWIDLPPNVAPVSALAMFAAVYLPRRWAMVVPFSLMLLSDALIGWYNIGVVISVYASFGLSFVLGGWIRRRTNVSRIVAGSLVASVLFFLITNAAVWIFEAAYPNTLAGLMQSYVAGLPFFRNTLFGDLAYTGLFFGLYNAVVVYSKRFVHASSALLNG